MFGIWELRRRFGRSRKVLGDNGSGTSAGVAAGIRWAIRKKVHIISMSLGSPYYSRTIHQSQSEKFMQAGNPSDRSTQYIQKLREGVKVKQLIELARDARFWFFWRVNAPPKFKVGEPSPLFIVTPSLAAESVGATPEDYDMAALLDRAAQNGAMAMIHGYKRSREASATHGEIVKDRAHRGGKILCATVSSKSLSMGLKVLDEQVEGGPKFRVFNLFGVDGNPYKGFESVQIRDRGTFRLIGTPDAIKPGEGMAEKAISPVMGKLLFTSYYRAAVIMRDLLKATAKVLREEKKRLTPPEEKELPPSYPSKEKGETTEVKVTTIECELDTGEPVPIPEIVPYTDVKEAAEDLRVTNDCLNNLRYWTRVIEIANIVGRTELPDPPEGEWTEEKVKRTIWKTQKYDDGTTLRVRTKEITEKVMKLPNGA